MAGTDNTMTIDQQDMTIDELKAVLQEYGIAGAGGAGFPSYGKISDKIETLILNCAECEPLIKVHRQMLALHAKGIIAALKRVAKTVGAAKILIAVKPSYKEAIEAVEAEIIHTPEVELRFLKEAYPVGDEVITIYEATGKVVPPGSIPIEVGVAVFNVETAYNIYLAIEKKQPVMSKYLTIAGEVEHPITVKLPIGMSVKEAVSFAGAITTKDYVYLAGGPMTGSIVKGHDLITKTSNAILVLPSDHVVIRKKNSNAVIDMQRAMASCCQCRMCTDLCPRYLLGHPIEPHEFMRSATTGVTKDLSPFLDTYFCSSCGLCEMFSCMQNLSPRSLINSYKNGLIQNGVKKPEHPKQSPVNLIRDYRMVPEERLVARIDLEKYDEQAPLTEELQPADSVKLLLKQHIGAPAVGIVVIGQSVVRGEMIAKAAPGTLSIPVHASIDGVITEIGETYITISNIS